MIDYRRLENQDDYWGQCILRDFISSGRAARFGIDSGENFERNLIKATSSVLDKKNKSYLEGIQKVFKKDLQAAVNLFLEARVFDANDPQINAAVAMLSTLAKDYARALECGVTALKNNHELGNQLLELCVFEACDALQIGYSSPRILYPLPPKLLQATGVHCAQTSAKPIASAPNTKPRVFFACDSKYLNRFGLACAMSAFNFELPVHAHVYDPEEADVVLLNNLKEKFDFGWTYTALPEKERNSLMYSLRRFIDFREVAAGYTQQCWLFLDADTILNRDPASLFLENESLHFAYDPIAPVFCRYSAGAIGIKGDQDSMRFVWAHAEYIKESISENKCRWFTDQISLYLVRKGLCERMKFNDIKYDLFDIHQRNTSFVWTVTNDKNAMKYRDRSAALLSQLKEVIKNSNNYKK